MNVTNRRSRPIPDGKGGYFLEEIQPGVFQRATKKAEEIKLCLDHRREIGGTKSNLSLKEDVIGLKARAEVTDSETVKAAEEKRLRGWSFGFRKPREERAEENGMSIRKISDLELTEVSIIDNKMKPWYNSTTIEARAEGEDEIEVRAQEDDLDYISNKKPENDVEKSRAKIKKMIEEAGGNI